MYHFCTYFDINYLPRALALRDSLERHSPGFTLHCLALDDQCHATLAKTRPGGIVLIRLADFEEANPGLRETRADRSWAEYCFTCAGVLPKYVLSNNPTAESVALVDADIYFFHDPAPIYEELEGYSLGLTEHRFTRMNRRALKYGRFNVGWIGFRNDAIGNEAAAWWSERCIEWCYDRVEDGKFANQRYLDMIPCLFGATKIIQHIGAGVAPWNIGNYRLSFRSPYVLVNDLPIIYFHFASFRQLRPWLFSTSFGACFARPSRLVRRSVFGPYICDIQRNAPELVATRTSRGTEERAALRRMRLRGAARFILGLLFCEYIVRIRGRVI